MIVGLHVSGGFTVVDTGLNVMTDMTVYGNVLLANSPIVFSDRRLKTDIQPLLEPLTKLSQLRGVSYIWNNSIDSRFSFISNDDKRHIGMIAQEVKDIYPELVEEISENGKIFVTKEDNDDVYLGVRYPEMIPILVEAVKEMNERIDTLITAIQSPSIEVFQNSFLDIISFRVNKLMHDCKRLEIESNNLSLLIQ